MKVLLVDDSMTMRRIQKNELTSVGITEILEASDGVEAIDALKQSQDIDLVLLDWNMPNMDGLTALKTIRSDSSLNHVKVFMCTSEADQNKVMEALRAGANNYIVKPFTRDILRDKLGIKK